MKKILITYASYGSGHKTIANYIKDYLGSNNYEIKVIDIMDYTNNIANFSIKMFDYVYKHRLEKSFTFLYKSMDNNLLRKDYIWYFKHFIYNNKIKNVYLEFNPDIVISTHFYGSNVAAILKKAKLINPQIITIVTDYKVHKFWMSSFDKEEIFIVANNYVKNDMIKRNCYSQNIYPYGLPYNIKKVLEMLPKDKIYQKYNINSRKKIILFFGGGSNGSEAYIKYLKVLLKLKLNYEILFICGNSEKLKIMAEKEAINYQNVKIYGFINNVYELLEIADLVITKPGGATVTECLEMQKFVILLPGIGGQEKYNADFVIKNHYGVMVNYKLTFILFLKRYVINNELYKNIYNNNKIKNESLSKIKKLIEKL